MDIKAIRHLFQEYRYEAAIIAANIILLALLLPLGAMGYDDWGYLTSPKTSHIIGYTRLFDSLFHQFVKTSPWLFPWFNHILMVCGHTISAILFYKITSSRMEIGKQLSFVFALLFTFYTGTFSSMANTDTLNNILPLMFIALGIYFWDRVENVKKIVAVYVCMSILAMLSKESGVTALIIIPAFALIDLYADRNDHKHIKNCFSFICISGIIIFSSYFAIFYYTQIRPGTFSLIKETSVSSAYYLIAFLNNMLNAYTPAPNLLHIQYALLGYGATVPVWEYIFVVTTLLSGILIIITGFCACTRKFTAAILFLMGVIAVLPYIPRGAPSEMYAYIASWFALMFIAYLCKYLGRRSLAVCLGLFVLTNTVSWLYKYTIAMESSSVGRQISESFVEQLGDRELPDEPSLLFCIINGDRRKVDWYGLPPAYYHLDGVALNAALGWNAQISCFYLFNRDDYWSIEAFVQDAEYHYDLSDEALLQYAQDYLKKERELEKYDIAVILLNDGALYVY